MGDQYIIIAGNVVDGLQHFGPFACANEAGDWANEELSDTWVCAKLAQVSDPDAELRRERDRLLAVLDACGGRNVEIAEQIDALNAELGESEEEN